MQYRNGVYVAFNGCNTTDPSKSDIKYFQLLKAWAANKNIDFNFSNSHDKTYQVNDGSNISTLKSRLQERMRCSKSMLLLITENSSENRGLLNWEIEQCVKQYKLPVIVAYTMCDDAHIISIDFYEKYWPETLKKFIRNNEASTIHTTFRADNILYAINEFSCNHMPMYNITYV